MEELSPVHTGDKVEFNTVETSNKLATKSTVADTVTLLPVLTTNRQQLEFDSLSRSTLLPIRSTLSLTSVYGALGAGE